MKLTIDCIAGKAEFRAESDEEARDLKDAILKSGNMDPLRIIEELERLHKARQLTNSPSPEM